MCDAYNNNSAPSVIGYQQNRPIFLSIFIDFNNSIKNRAESELFLLLILNVCVGLWTLYFIKGSVVLII